MDISKIIEDEFTNQRKTSSQEVVEAFYKERL